VNEGSESYLWLLCKGYQSSCPLDRGTLASTDERSILISSDTMLERRCLRSSSKRGILECMESKVYYFTIQYNIQLCVLYWIHKRHLTTKYTYTTKVRRNHRVTPHFSAPFSPASILPLEYTNYTIYISTISL